LVRYKKEKDHVEFYNLVSEIKCKMKRFYSTQYDDLQVDVVSSEIQKVAQKHEGRLHQHENVEAIQLLDNMGIVRRLQREKPFELV
jgi:hypothetical protein